MSIFSSFFGPTENEHQADANIDWIALHDMAQLDKIMADSDEKPIIIFKHSTRCGISRMVLKQFEKEYDLGDAVVPYFLDLLAHRDLSNAIAQRFDVEHQSPQLLLIKNGRSVYDASHSAIEVKDLHRNL